MNMKIFLCEVLKILSLMWVCVFARAVCACVCVKSITQALISNTATATQEHAHNLLNQLNMPARLLIDWHITNSCPVVQSCNCSIGILSSRHDSVPPLHFQCFTSSKSKYNQYDWQRNFGTFNWGTSDTITSVNEQIWIDLVPEFRGYTGAGL